MCNDSGYDPYAGSAVAAGGQFVDPVILKRDIGLVGVLNENIGKVAAF